VACEQTHLRAREGVAEPGVGTLKFGDLALQPIDFCKQRDHAFDVICLDRSNPLPASPVPDAAAI
jgi:hypothetical protein